jgi:hypothetical protein
VHSEQEQENRKIFDALIERRWGSSINPKYTEPDPEDTEEYDEYEDEDEEARVVPNIEDTVDTNGKLLNQHPAYDQIINAEVSLQMGDKMVTGKVTR